MSKRNARNPTVSLLVGVVALWGVAFLPISAQATTLYLYNVDGSSTGIGSSGPYGKLTVDDTGGILDITAELFGTFEFHNSNSSQQNSLLFDLVGAPLVDINVLTPEFARLGGNPAAGGQYDGPSFIEGGSPSSRTFWDYAIDAMEESCDQTCGSLLHLTVTLVNSFGVKSGDLFISSLNPFAYTDSSGDHNIYFVSALINTSNGLTGNVGATLTSPIPLPAAFPLFVTALGGMGLLGWLRRRKAAVA